MRGKENRIDLCFNLLDIYEAKIKEALSRNNISHEDSNEIIKNFHFKNEILFSLNKEYKKGRLLKDFCDENNLSSMLPDMLSFHHCLYKHQENAIKSIQQGKCTIVSTGTGSGKTESFLIPILDYCIKNKGKKGVKAIIIYPMNALAGDQLRRIEEAAKVSEVTYAIFNGETPKRKDDEMVSEENNIMYREDIVENKPDILITNYVMLERIITNEEYLPVFNAKDNVFKFIVLDEIHTYNGNKALHIKFLLDRLRFYVNANVVQIGCSATLSRNKDGVKTDGYISGEIDEFITKMFGLKTNNQYQYIEPIYEDINKSDFNVDNIDYKVIQEDPKTRIIKNYLFDGCRNFSEILIHLNNKGINLSEKELREYFSSILSVNEKYNENPILDFRIHLFLLDIGKHLRRCINCGKHYTLYVDKCNDCGHMILPVYKENPKLVIGNLKNGEIIDPNKVKCGEKKNLVLIDFNTTNNTKFEHELTFNSYQYKCDSIKLVIDKDGKNKVYWDNSITNSFIELQGTVSDMFLYELLKVNFEALDKKDKKILTFIDNREKCGRYSTVFGDKLLSEFFFEIIKFCNNCSNMSVDDLGEKSLDLLQEYLQENNKIDENIKEIIANDFDIWFRRILINKEFRNLHNGLKFKINKQHPLNDADNFIIDIACDEGAFFEEKLRRFGKVIRISRSSFEFDKGIAFRTFPNKNTISLSSQAIKYKYIIEKYEQDELRDSIKKLVAYKILNESIQELNDEVKKDIHFPRSIFYVNRDNILVETDNSNYSSLDDIFQEHLLLTGAHTSEVEKEVKKAHEDDFQNGNINLLVATPTLEMGIDIGSLSFVYMLGVPPVPSNYAQRSGRAGRRGDRFAGIITVCSENSHHDWYYFYNPKEIIEGLITPPKFDINNKKVLNKHVNTIIFPRVGNKIGSNIGYEEKLYLQNTCNVIFDREININSQIQFLKSKIISRNLYSRESLYNNAIYPEYCFNRNEVKLIKRYTEINNNTTMNTDVQIGTREPELAYKQIIPGEIMFIGEKYYYLDLLDNSKSFTSMNNKNVISSWKYKCENSESNIKVKKENIPKHSYVVIDLNKDYHNIKRKGPVKIYHNKNMKIEFLSEQVISIDESVTGYQLFRDTIVFEFDSNVISKEQSISLISLLDKTIKYELGLDENEISLIMDDEILIDHASDIEDNKSYVLIYDKTGNENIDMEEILGKICSGIDNKFNGTLLSKAYDRVSNCECEKQSGCYLCIKSFNTQRYSYSLSKASAKNFIGYLLGKEKLRPCVSETEEILRYELDIDIRKKGNDFRLTLYDKEKILECRVNQNETIFNGILYELKAIYENDDIETIRITSPLDYLVRGINEEENIKVSDSSLNLFMFYKQAFKSIIAEKAVK